MMSVLLHNDSIGLRWVTFGSKILKIRDFVSIFENSNRKTRMIGVPVYGLAQLQSDYQRASVLSDLDARKAALEAILKKLPDSVAVYQADVERIAAETGVVLKREQIQQSATSIAQSAGLALGSVTGYAYIAAGLGFLYDALTKKQRTAAVNDAVARVQAAQAKLSDLNTLYQQIQTDLGRISWLRLARNPLLWLVFILVLLIFLTR